MRLLTVWSQAHERGYTGLGGEIIGEHWRGTMDRKWLRNIRIGGKWEFPMRRVLKVVRSR